MSHKRAAQKSDHTSGRAQSENESEFSSLQKYRSSKGSRRNRETGKPVAPSLPHHVRDDVLARLSPPAPPAPPCGGPPLKQFFIITARQRTRKREPAAQLLPSPALGCGRRSRADRSHQDDDQLRHSHLQAAGQPFRRRRRDGPERDGRLRAELFQRGRRRAGRERKREREVLADLPRSGPDERSHEEVHWKSDGKCDPFFSKVFFTRIHASPAQRLVAFKFEGYLYVWVAYFLFTAFFLSSPRIPAKTEGENSVSLLRLR